MVKIFIINPVNYVFLTVPLGVFIQGLSQLNVEQVKNIVDYGICAI